MCCSSAVAPVGIQCTWAAAVTGPNNNTSSHGITHQQLQSECEDQCAREQKPPKRQRALRTWNSVMVMRGSPASLVCAAAIFTRKSLGMPDDLPRNTRGMIMGVRAPPAGRSRQLQAMDTKTAHGTTHSTSQP